MCVGLQVPKDSLVLEHSREEHSSHSWSQCYATHVHSVALGVTQGERAIFLTRRDVIEQWWSWMGPLVPPLGVLWLNGTANFPLLKFLTLGLVSGAPRG